jgi:RNA polymerase sigma factor (sigma-70 family)
MNLSTGSCVYNSDKQEKGGDFILQTERIRGQLLLLRYRRGDIEAFEELVTIWERPLFYYIRRIVGSEEDAWDVSQEVWLQVMRKMDQLRNPESLSAWLYQIARNLALNHCRANRKQEFSVTNVDNLPDMAEDVRAKFSTSEAAAIHWGLDQLPLAQREVLTLNFLEEFTLKEISEIIKVPVGTVKSRLFYAKKTLRVIMKKEGTGHE